MSVPINGYVAGSRISGPELADLLGRWSAMDGPLYRLLADRMARLADTGELPSGLRLPAERELAAALSVSRNTAAAAYQVLRDEGLAHTRQGAGTRITSHRTTPAAVHRANGFFAGMLESAAVDVDLSVTAPDCAPQVAAALAEPATVLGAGRGREVTAGGGYYPLGLPALREAVADLLTTAHRLPTASGQVLVTTGSQQAIDLLMRSHVLAGQPVVVEDPTFPGALDALHRAGARPIALPAGTGADPGRLERLVATHRPALVYLVPTFHNPTGLVMPERDRQHVAGLAAAYPGTVFVDDLTLAELVLSPDPVAPPAPLASLLPGLRNIVTIGSLSKTYWGGLRTGWIRASPGMIGRLAAAKSAADLGSPAYPQAIAAALITGQHAEIVGWRTAQLRVQRDALQDALRAHLPQWSWAVPRGGLNLWVRLPEHADGGVLARTALRHGVAIVPGRLLSVTNCDHGSVRIAYTRPPAELRSAVPALARAWQETGRVRMPVPGGGPAGRFRAAARQAGAGVLTRPGPGGVPARRGSAAGSRSRR